MLAGQPLACGWAEESFSQTGAQHNTTGNGTSANGRRCCGGGGGESPPPRRSTARFLFPARAFSFHGGHGTEPRSRNVHSRNDSLRNREHLHHQSAACLRVIFSRPGSVHTLVSQESPLLSLGASVAAAAANPFARSKVRRFLNGGDCRRDFTGRSGTLTCVRDCGVSMAARSGKRDSLRCASSLHHDAMNLDAYTCAKRV